MNTYFIDSNNGNDSADGRTPKTAFCTLDRVNEITLEPGDRVLLKRDCVFKGHLDIVNSGACDHPIVVSSYGSGLRKPVVWAEESKHAVLAAGEYLLIQDLEITNPKSKYGIRVCSLTTGAIRGVVISGCYIHDVFTINDLPERHVSSGGWDHAMGGISVETSKEAPSWYENLRIEHNVIERVNRTGIWLGGQWFNRFKNSFPWVTNQAPGMYDPWYPHHHVYIGHNFVDHAYGDGIIGIGCVDLLMEHNKVFYANCMSRVGSCNAGLWSMCCDGAVVQYNEVAFTGKEYGGDGEGYDIDNCSLNTVFQYNYSHDNGGGFLLMCNITCNSKESHHNHIIRNNISINDATEQDSSIFNFTGSMRDISILNNTIYTENQNRYRLFYIADFASVGLAQDVLFGNNLVISKYSDHWNCFEANGRFVFDTNVFLNCPPLPPKDNIIDRNIQQVNPVLQGKASVPGTRLETQAFIPCWNSPLLRLGKHFEDNADRDYNGINTQGHNYIGALYYQDANIG